MTNGRNIFMDLIYGRNEIDVSGTMYEEIFKRSDIDIKSIKLPELLWCANEIADSMSTVDGVEFLKDTINIASYFMKNEL